MTNAILEKAATTSPVSIPQTFQHLVDQLYFSGIKSAEVSYEKLGRGEKLEDYSRLDYVNFQNALSLLVPIVRLKETSNGPAMVMSKDGPPSTRPFELHSLDFDDFLDFATSPICPGVPLNTGFTFLHGYEALPGTSGRTPFKGSQELSLLTFSPYQAVLAATGEKLIVYLALRVTKDSAEYKSRVGVSTVIIPPITVAIEFRQEGGTLIEVNRHQIRCDLDRFVFSSMGWVRAMQEVVEKYPQNDRTKLMRFANTVDSWMQPLAEVFELAKLMVHLPQYFEFMYDLVITSKYKAGNQILRRKMPRVKGKNRKTITSQEPIYKIVKSIRVRYEAEEASRRQLSENPRLWTAPSYKFEVQGHWRTFADSNWIGHDPEGAEIQGKTWVHSFEKGADKEATEKIVLEGRSGVVIKVKETLAYGRDVLSSFGTRPEARGTPPSGERPSADYLYSERCKLTAGLRFLVLKRDKYRCCLCGASGTDGARLEVDHKIALVKWGKTELSNLWTLCRPCNGGKGARDLM